MGTVGKVYYVQGPDDKAPSGIWHLIDDGRVPPQFAVWVGYINENKTDIKSQATHTQKQIIAWLKVNGIPVK